MQNLTIAENPDRKCPDLDAFTLAQGSCRHQHIHAVASDGLRRLLLAATRVGNGTSEQDRDASAAPLHFLPLELGRSFAWSIRRNSTS